MVEVKNAKIKEWNSKMMGFYNKASVNKQMQELDRADELRKKIERQTFVEAKADDTYAPAALPSLD